MTSNVRAAGAPRRQCLTFLMDRGEYAVDLSRVREILPYTGATRVPRVPAWVRGVVNLRGSVVPIVDLAVWSGAAQAAVTPLTCLVMVEVGAGMETSMVGLVVDAVHQVLELDGEALQPPPSFATRIPSELLLGAIRSEGAFALLLDLDRVLAQGALLHGLRTSGPAPEPTVRPGRERA